MGLELFFSIPSLVMRSSYLCLPVYVGVIALLFCCGQRYPLERDPVRRLKSLIMQECLSGDCFANNETQSAVVRW